ncbi:hypothetical protein PHYBOEH_010017 [Phytophthora boehmeriae]|uniref:M96 mating-specific protein family n=1 Tax=Phytophthora boehmeriae TaxID=109152 RepID=A0A8T1VSM8_9STRA|nr:hypothetical protein PHYBOEH_010017 [Phytophthora boehmeriae]
MPLDLTTQRATLSEQVQMSRKAIHDQDSTTSFQFGPSEVEFNLNDFEDIEMLSDADAFVMTEACNPVAISDKVAIRRAMEAKKRRVSRQREKVARDALLHHYQALTNELVRLKQAKEAEHARLVSLRTPQFYQWRKVAKKQLHERLHAEEEQKYLSGLVTAQSNYINAIEVEARKRSDEPNVLKNDAITISDKKNLCITAPVEEEICNAYMQELRVNYEQLDAFFEEIDIAELREAVQNTVQMREDGEIEFYQQLTKSVEPFSLRKTATTFWDVSVAQILGRGCHEHFTSGPANTFATKFRETIVSKTGVTVPLLQRSVAQRFLEDDRVVHVWKQITEGEGEFSGLYMEETGWLRLRLSTEATGPETTIEMCTRKFPKSLKSPSVNGEIVRQFHEVLRNVGDKTKTDIVSWTQNALLEETLDGIGN